MSVRIDFVEASPLWKRALPARKLTRSAVSAAVDECRVKLRRGAEMSVHLIDDKGMRAINAKWRHRDGATNVLSFPASDPGGLSQARLLGDVLISFETLKREAEEEGKALADHFSHLVVHGFLHLLGFDHIEEADAEKMELIEIRALARLGVANPYAERELTDS
jgi:probable rRNA maturation factor